LAQVSRLQFQLQHAYWFRGTLWSSAMTRTVAPTSNWQSYVYPEDLCISRSLLEHAKPMPTPTGNSRDTPCFSEYGARGTAHALAGTRAAHKQSPQLAPNPAFRRNVFLDRLTPSKVEFSQEPRSVHHSSSFCRQSSQVLSNINTFEALLSPGKLLTSASRSFASSEELTAGWRDIMEPDLASDCSTTDSLEVRSSRDAPVKVLCLAEAVQDDDGVEIPLPSVGSSGHHAGTCEPCAFLYKKTGCGKGTFCDFCHVCGPNVRQQRRRDKRQAQKAQKIRASPLT